MAAIPDYSYNILICGSGRKKNACTIESNKPSTRCWKELFVKDLYGAKYRFLIKKLEDIGLKHF